jgi:hypothetical protein
MKVVDSLYWKFVNKVIIVYIYTDVWINIINFGNPMQYVAFMYTVNPCTQTVTVSNK